MTASLKRFLAAALMAAMAAALVLLPISAKQATAANEPLHVDAKCTLVLKTPGTMPELQSPDAVIPVAIYRVAEMNADGTFVPVGAFSGITIDQEIIKENNSEIVADLQKKAMAIINSPDVETAPVEGAPTSIVGGTLTYDNAETGIYLIVPQNINLGDYTYKFMPTIVPLPIYMADKATQSNYYSYLVTASIKVEKTDLMGSLEIVKELLTYETTQGSPMFVFHVVATKPGVAFPVYDNVVSVQFDGPGVKSVLLDSCIPVGAEVTVTEVYSGSSYKLVSGPDPAKVTISATDVASVKFVNDHDGDRGGGGVNNTFTYIKDGDDAKKNYWEWVEPAPAAPSEVQ